LIEFNVPTVREYIVPSRPSPPANGGKRRLLTARAIGAIRSEDRRICRCEYLTWIWTVYVPSSPFGLNSHDEPSSNDGSMEYLIRGHNIVRLVSRLYLDSGNGLGWPTPYPPTRARPELPAILPTPIRRHQRQGVRAAALRPGAVGYYIITSYTANNASPALVIATDRSCSANCDSAHASTSISSSSRAILWGRAVSLSVAILT